MVENPEDRFSRDEAHLYSCDVFNVAVFAVVLFFVNLPYEPRHDKTNKVTVRPAKTQISLGIHPVWSESSLFA